jgi:hypothetical protein
MKATPLPPINQALAAVALHEQICANMSISYMMATSEFCQADPPAGHTSVQHMVHFDP